MLRKIAWGLAIVAATFAATAGYAQSSIPPMDIVPPADQPGTIPLYGPATPGDRTTEAWFKWYEGQVISVRNVTYPTLTPFLPPRGKANGTAVIVAPGGAFEFLSIEHEGWKVAKALAARGFTAFVLKYRVKPTPADQRQWSNALMSQLMEMVARNRAAARGVGPASPDMKVALNFPPATADGLAALKLIRTDAARWHIDPARVGIIGFSAGAALALSTVLEARPGEAPAFVSMIYGPLEPVAVPKQAPPLFAAVAIDDPLFIDYSLPKEWHESGAQAELHVYQSGAHGFGLGRAGSTNALMLDQFVAWLSMQGFTAPRRQSR